MLAAGEKTKIDSVLFLVSSFILFFFWKKRKDKRERERERKDKGRSPSPERWKKKKKPRACALLLCPSSSFHPNFHTHSLSIFLSLSRILRVSKIFLQSERVFWGKHPLFSSRSQSSRSSSGIFARVTCL